MKIGAFGTTTPDVEFECVYIDHCCPPDFGREEYTGSCYRTPLLRRDIHISPAFASKYFNLQEQMFELLDTHLRRDGEQFRIEFFVDEQKFCLTKIVWLCGPEKISGREVESAEWATPEDIRTGKFLKAESWQRDEVTAPYMTIGESWPIEKTRIIHLLQCDRGQMGGGSVVSSCYHS